MQTVLGALAMIRRKRKHDPRERMSALALAELSELNEIWEGLPPLARISIGSRNRNLAPLMVRGRVCAEWPCVQSRRSRRHALRAANWPTPRPSPLACVVGRRRRHATLSALLDAVAQTPMTRSEMPHAAYRGAARTSRADASRRCAESGQPRRLIFSMSAQGGSINEPPTLVGGFADPVIGAQETFRLHPHGILPGGIPVALRTLALRRPPLGSGLSVHRPDAA